MQKEVAYEAAYYDAALTTEPPKEATINLAIGQSCPVRCEGCYNHFGDTFKAGGLLTANEIVDFAAVAVDEGVSQATVSGGDPLSHPEITTILAGLKNRQLKVKLDTVGSAFLEEASIVFKGRGSMRHISAEEISEYVDFVNIPLDGASQETVARFRKGRSNLFNETRLVAQLLKNAGIKFGYNTVANQANVAELESILAIVEADGATEWQVFEYDPEGPNLTNKKDALTLPQGVFRVATQGLMTTKPDLKVNCKSLEQRDGIYFLVDDSGLAWRPAGSGLRHVHGHITRDREKVLNALRLHIQDLRSK